MYSNPAHIRKHAIKIRVNDFELRMIELLAEANASQVAVICRELMLESINDEALTIKQESLLCGKSA